MLDSNLQLQLKGYLENLRKPVELVVSTGNDKKSTETKDLAAEITTLSDLVSWRMAEDDERKDRIPSFAIYSEGDDTGISFSGIPLGHEFTSLVLALLHSGGHPPKEEKNLLDRIGQISGEYQFETYISLSCQNCPDVVQALNIMSALNPSISHAAIDGALFTDEAEKRNVMAVPSIYLNGEPFGQGRMNLEQIISRLEPSSKTDSPKEIEVKDPFDMLIVGGGPAGAAAAIYAARKGIRTGIAAERFGGQVADTLDIENLISITHTEGPALVASMETHVNEYEVDIFNNQLATKLVPSENSGGLHEVIMASGETLRARSLILSTGARWRQLGVPGEEEYLNKGVAYCPHCDGPLFKGKRVAVISGGNSGVEAAIDLAGIVDHVTLIEYDDQLRADDILLTRLNSLKNVKIIIFAETNEIIGDGNRVAGLVFTDRTTGEALSIDLEGVFIQIGLVPNTEWLKGTLGLTQFGEIEIDSRGQTTIPGIFAAGDATTVPHKQIIIGMGDGAKASLSAFDYLIRLAPDAETVQVAEYR